MIGTRPEKKYFHRAHQLFVLFSRQHCHRCRRISSAPLSQILLVRSRPQRARSTNVSRANSQYRLNRLLSDNPSRKRPYSIGEDSDGFDIGSEKRKFHYCVNVIFSSPFNHGRRHDRGGDMGNESTPS